MSFAHDVASIVVVLNRNIRINDQSTAAITSTSHKPRDTGGFMSMTPIKAPNSSVDSAELEANLAEPPLPSPVSASTCSIR